MIQLSIADRLVSAAVLEYNGSRLPGEFARRFFPFSFFGAER